MPADDLPRWDLTPIFPDFDSQEYQQARAVLGERLGELERLLERYRVGEEGADRDASAFAAVISAYNAVREAALPLLAYARLRLSTDAGDRRAAAALGGLEAELLALDKLEPRLTRWLASFPPDFDAGEYGLLLAEARVLAGHMMSDAEEELAAELSLSGRRAWYRLYGNVSSRITVSLDGEELPMAALRNRAHDPSEEVRRRAYRAELAAWRERQDELAACLNGVKGEAVVLARRRGWEDELEPTLLANRVSRRALEAMMTAVEESLPVWRRYFAAKAGLLGKEKLDWWDLFAPVGRERRWSWEEAREFIVTHLRAFSPPAAELAGRAFAERWIDAEPRAGKRGGAFCMAVGGGASRVLTNFGGGFQAVSTLAHELGHAYHNLRLAERPPLLRRLPMTLAETASIMNETVVTRAALDELAGEERLAVLDAWLQGAAQVVVDIYSRFLFESRLFAERRQRELAPEELSALMEEAQQRAYGEALASRHPFMWAVKPHYYGSDYYNYPYTFGLLFGLGLYAAYQDDPASFAERYDALLSDTGVADARTLAGRFGFDIESAGFWRRGLGLLAGQVEEFSTTAAARA
ncbi:M3 family oligoendopeptidase [Oceanithermus sp.]